MIIDYIRGYRRKSWSEFIIRTINGCQIASRANSQTPYNGFVCNLSAADRVRICLQQIRYMEFDVANKSVAARPVADLSTTFRRHISDNVTMTSLDLLLRAKEKKYVVI